MSDRDNLILLALLRLLVEDDKRTEQIEDSKRYGFKIENKNLTIILKLIIMIILFNII